jgi:putative ABC transport system permease protein
MSRLALWLALRLVRVMATLVPRATRADWAREWDAELQHRAAHLQHERNLTWRTNMDLIRRALGSLPDAAWIRRQFTSDADAMHDTTHAVRLLLKAPAFTAIVLLVFAIGIGAMTAIVSIVDALFLRALPMSQPEQVMTIWQYNRDTGIGELDVAPGNAIDWVQRAGSSRSFEAIAFAEPWNINSNIPGQEPEYLEAVRVSEQFFAVLGTPMLHGRAFLPHEYLGGSGRFAILSFPMWRDRFGADPSVVGRTVQLDERGAHTVVGVLPPGFELRLFNENRTRRPEASVWLPKQGLEEYEPRSRGLGYWNVIGRLRPGVSIAQAGAELDVISEQLAREYPQTNRSIAAQVVPLRTHLAGSLRGVLPLLLGAAAMLLIVACANVANLLLARGVARGREFAVRQALGASRFRLARQMLVESLLLAIVGGTLGLALARWTLDVIARLRPMDVALVDQIPIDVRAAAIAFGIAVVAAIVAGLAPSSQLSRPVSAGALRDGLISSRGRVRGALVVVEVAAAVVLAVGAGLLVRSFVTVQRVDPGFRPDRVAALQIFASPRLNTPEKRIVFFEQVIDRMRALPGVVAAGGVSAMPFGVARVAARGPLTIDGRPPTTGEGAQVLTTAVAGDYFRVMGVPLLKGRLFDASDTAASRQVVLVSQKAAQTLWAGADPVGSRVRFRFNATSYDAEVIGVVGEVHHEALDRPAAAELFLPYAQSGFYALTVVVHTAPGSPTTLQTLKAQIWTLDQRQSIFRTAAVEDWISQSLDNRRFSLFLLAGFALATLLLASAGVYGVMSFTTGQRSREFGVRLALGAEGHDIVRLVVGDGLKLAGLGVIVGILVALPLTGLLRAFLFGVTAVDPMTFLAVSIATVLIAAAACYVPAGRALKVDPTEALRID